MLTLDPRRLAETAMPVATGWLLGACMEARGKQDLWLRQKPEVLGVVREQAILQSVESSNRIEGVTGEWKKRDNEIVQISPGGERSVRFVPSPAKAPAIVELLCQRYRSAGDEERVPPLLTVATFVFDLLCIHPFRDGNRRVSRLVTRPLLEAHGFRVAQYGGIWRAAC